MVEYKKDSWSKIRQRSTEFKYTPNNGRGVDGDGPRTFNKVHDDYQFGCLLLAW